MHILIGLAMVLALLYFWLIGHWFARVLVFLMLAVIGFIAGAAAVNTTAHGADPNAFGLILFGLLGAALAWPVAGLPVYYRRYQSRELDRRVNHVLAVLGARMPRLPEGH